VHDRLKSRPATDGPVGRQLLQDRNDRLLGILGVSRQLARGTWNWLTNVYTVGVGSICEKAIGELTTATAANTRPTTTPINRLFIRLPWLASQQRSATRWKVVPRRSLADFTDGEGYAVLSSGYLECQGLRPRTGQCALTVFPNSVLVNAIPPPARYSPLQSSSET